MWYMFILSVQTRFPSKKYAELLHHLKVIVHSPLPFLLFINSIVHGKWHDLMLTVFLQSVFCARSSCCVEKATKKREDMQGVHEGITTTVGFPRCFFFFFFTPRSLTPDQLHATLSVFVSLVVLLQYVPGGLLVQDMAASVLWLGCPFFFFLSFCPSEDATISITPSLSCFPSSVCYHLYIFLSFVSLSLSSFPPPPTHSLSLHFSCRLFIRCVNNCLPTVVIAPPCQLEVWSKWQCAQFSLAYIVQFLVSLVPLAKKPSPIAVVFYQWY